MGENIELYSEDEMEVDDNGEIPESKRKVSDTSPHSRYIRN